MQYVIQYFDVKVEYYDQVADEWFETKTFTSDFRHIPYRILMPVGHQGTYFRSRISMRTPWRYTISLAYTGTPPTGETPSGCTLKLELATRIKST